jgi:hypothetical protein
MGNLTTKENLSVLISKDVDRVRRLFVVIATGLLTFSAYAQSQSSLEDSLRFLHGVLTAGEPVVNGQGTLRDTDTFVSNGCFVTVTCVNENFAATGKSQGATTITDTYSLKDMDPASIRVREFGDSFPGSSDVEVDTTNFRNVVLRTGYGTRVEVSNSGVTIDSNYASRFAQALKRAIDLCGGKPPAF